VAAIQPNIRQAEKMNPDSAADNIQRLQTLNEQAVDEKADLVLWPEACVPGGMFADQEVTDWVKAQAGLHKALMLGTDDLNRGGEGDDHNSAALIVRGKKDIAIHDKVNLVPFGEYLPLRPILGWAFSDLVPGDFVPGLIPAQLPLDSPDVMLGPLICFEDTQPDIARAQVRGGAELLVNLTNDGWFGQSAELEQHLSNALFRCIETRVPLVRGTNTGTTASVDPFGRVDRWMPAHTTGVKSRTIPIAARTPATFYVRHGDLFSPTCAGITALAMVARFLRNRAKRKA
jgi:apolipoprotein N-acyltransferase